MKAFLKSAIKSKPTKEQHEQEESHHELPQEQVTEESGVAAARAILERLAGTSPARLGTSHGAELVTAAIQWLAVHKGVGQ